MTELGKVLFKFIESSGVLQELLGIGANAGIVFGINFWKLVGFMQGSSPWTFRGFGYSMFYETDQGKGGRSSLICAKTSVCRFFVSNPFFDIAKCSKKPRVKIWIGEVFWCHVDGTKEGL